MRTAADSATKSRLAILPTRPQRTSFSKAFPVTTDVRHFCARSFKGSGERDERTSLVMSTRFRTSFFSESLDGKLPDMEEGRIRGTVWAVGEHRIFSRYCHAARSPLLP